MEYGSLTENELFNNTAEHQKLLSWIEQCQNLSIQVLELLNQGDTQSDLIRDILFLIKMATGLEAVGIRLKEGEEFPYYETIGFSKLFVQKEKYLCERDEDGEIIRDSRGNPTLECMCGNVICGRTDPSLPFFTRGGSFWTNSTTELLASTTEEDRQGRTRNRCNKEGYESVALVPLRCNKINIGLLQLNDSRKNLFTAHVIRFFEGVGSSIGIAFKIKKIEDAVLHSGRRQSPVVETFKSSYDKLRTDVHTNQLTQRECEILQLIASGLSAGKIADRLCVSIHTVATHRARIKHKLGIRKSTGLVGFAMKIGLV